MLDFGIAKFFDTPTGLSTTDTAPGILLGTPLYMSPEQRQGGPVDRTWDLWALAVIAYEMLAGVHPFKAVPPSPAAGLPGTGPLTELSQLPPDTAAAWSIFFEKALAVDPSLRPRTAEQFRVALDAVVA